MNYFLSQLETVYRGLVQTENGMLRVGVNSGELIDIIRKNETKLQTAITHAQHHALVEDKDINGALQIVLSPYDFSKLVA